MLSSAIIRRAYASSASGGSRRVVECWVVSRHEPNTRRTGVSASSAGRVRITGGGYGESGSGQTFVPSTNTSYVAPTPGRSPSTITSA